MIALKDTQNVRWTASCHYRGELVSIPLLLEDVGFSAMKQPSQYSRGSVSSYTILVVTQPCTILLHYTLLIVFFAVVVLFFGHVMIFVSSRVKCVDNWKWALNFNG